MDRITVNLDDSTADKVRQRADSEKRSVSNYIELLIERDLEAAGIPAGKGPSDAEFNAVVVENGGRAKVFDLLTKLNRPVLTRAARRAR